MGFEDIVAQRYALTESRVKEGYNGIVGGKPKDLYEHELNELEPFLPKNYRVELDLRIEDIPDQMELEYGNFRATYNGEMMVGRATSYAKLVDARELLSLVFNGIHFRFRSADDAFETHQLIYKLYRRLEEMNSSIGVRMYISPYILNKLHDQIVKMEREDKFILDYIRRVREQGGDLSIFFTVDKRQVHRHSAKPNTELSEFTKIRVKQLREQGVSSTLGVKQEEPIYQEPVRQFTRSANPNIPTGRQEEVKEEVKFVTNGELTFKKKTNNNTRIVVDFD